MALDEHGNARGGIRNPYVDVPAKKIGVRNEGAVPPIPNAHPVRGGPRRSRTEPALWARRLRSGAARRPS